MNKALRHTALTPAAARTLLVRAALPSSPTRAPLVPGLADAVAAAPGGLTSTPPLELSPTDSATESTKRAVRKSTRHRRQTLVMPFFSFAQRG